VARLHGARIEMLDNLPGLKFRLLFPPNLVSASSAAVHQGTNESHETQTKSHWLDAGRSDGLPGCSLVPTRYRVRILFAALHESAFGP
jgi:hypothetical protein